LRCAGDKLGASAASRPIRIVDGSRLEGPGDRVWRLHLCYDPVHGRIADAAITTMREGERLDRLSVTPGEIRLGDRGFPQPNGIKATLEREGDVLVRLTWNSLQLTDMRDKPLCWPNLFGKADKDGVLDLPVRMHKAHSDFTPMQMRLVIIKKPPAAAAKARATARRASNKDQRRRIDPRTLTAAGYVILLTSLDRNQCPADVVGALYRVRWQIELAIKRLKSILHVDRLPAKDPDLARAWLYAHLLLALMLDEKASEADALSPSAINFQAGLALARNNSPRRGAPRNHLAAA